MTAIARIRALTSQIPKVDANVQLAPVADAPERRELRVDLRLAGTRPSRIRIAASSAGFTVALEVEQEAAA